MPEAYLPATLMFGLLGGVALWGFSSLCWELARAQARCVAADDDAAFRAVRAIGHVAAALTLVYFVMMGASCLLVARRFASPLAWGALGLLLGVVHQHYLGRAEARVMRLMEHLHPPPPVAAPH